MKTREGNMTVLIAGGGIAGLTLGLTLHQIGVPFQLFEHVSTPKPLGVGINLQPIAVRELMELGLADILDTVGIQTKDYGFYTKTGKEIWTEKRGLDAGYLWPQYSVHRGRLQMALYEAVQSRAVMNCIQTGCTAIGYENTSAGVALTLHTQDGVKTVEGDILIGADGIHSNIRAQMYPNEGGPIWDGAIIWRGTTQAKPFLSQASMILSGNNTQRFVAYPITPVEHETGLTTVNWIAEKHVDPTSAISKEDWNREVDTSQFLPDFIGWNFEWLDIPKLIRGAAKVYEYPMVDREPVDSWTDGRVTLIGDAAHPTYPVGSSGASQAIVDARVLGAKLLETGCTKSALDAYEAVIRPVANRVTLANRGNGPDAIMQLAEDRCGGDFSKLGAALPFEERQQLALNYKKLAGVSPDDVNRRPPTISS